MSDNNWGDPLRERDLPNPELMLAQILSEAGEERVTHEEMEELDAPSSGNRWLYAVAAGVMVLALGTVGWMVLRPEMTEVSPAGRPTAAPPAAPTPTPVVEPTTDGELAAPAPAAAPTTRPATQVPTPTPTPTPSPSPTPTPTPTPTPEATAAVETTPPGIEILEIRRIAASSEGRDIVHVRYEICAGSGAPQVVGPVIIDPSAHLSAVAAPADMGVALGSGGFLVPDQCLRRVVSIDVEPTATSITIGVGFTFPASSPEAQWNTVHTTGSRI